MVKKLTTVAVDESKFGHVRLDKRNNGDLKAYVAFMEVGSVTSWGNLIIKKYLDSRRRDVRAGHQLLKKGNHASLRKRQKRR